ncbi:hypothetical protein [uncultured Rikenella sp.]|uniref:hypothetical protein n=1 Tax=uncultured Rikenella sp. TaxID=368003 RepID=UPI0026372963|nr:hypothetical protein [uncultured Rikenella sp.]
MAVLGTRAFREIQGRDAIPIEPAQNRTGIGPERMRRKGLRRGSGRIARGRASAISASSLPFVQKA